MTVKKLFFDESGFTGYNLLDPIQPIFSVASTSVEDVQSEEILAGSFPNYQGNEYKFSNIWASKNRNGLLCVADQLVILP